MPILTSEAPLAAVAPSPASGRTPSQHRHCALHDSWRLLDGGCEIGGGRWICADCWQRSITKRQGGAAQLSRGQFNRASETRRLAPAGNAFALLGR